MGKGKLLKFAEFDSFPNTFDAKSETKGKWKDFFGNDNPVVLELACGKGDYSIGLAKLFPEKNFIGIDIKGSRLWRGAKTCVEENLKNVAFLRIEIGNLPAHFDTNEVSEIWITFPDPQPAKERKRLMHPRFLNLYHSLCPNGVKINLKTDSDLLYEFTKEVIAYNQLQTIESIPNVYENSMGVSDILNIKTFYERIWLNEGRTIKYISFLLNKITDFPRKEKISEAI